MFPGSELIMLQASRCSRTSVPTVKQNCILSLTEHSSLWGILYLQVYNYFTSKSAAQDRLWMKFMVSFQFIMAPIRSFIELYYQIGFLWQVTIIIEGQ